MLKKFFSADLFKYNGVSNAPKFRNDYLKVLILFLATGIPLAIALFTYIITGMNIPNSGVSSRDVLITKIFIFGAGISTFVVYLIWILIHIKRFRYINHKSNNLALELFWALLLNIPFIAVIVGLLFAIEKKTTILEAKDQIDQTGDKLVLNQYQTKGYFKIPKSIIVILIIFVAIFTWSKLKDTEYDRLMRPVIESKIKNPHLIIDGVPEPSLPDKEENDKTLMGVDSNRNGIRDDVEIWINRTYKDKYMQWALKQYAKSFTVLLLNSESTNKTFVYQLTQQSEKDKMCISDVAAFLSNYEYDNVYLQFAGSKTLLFNLILNSNVRQNTWGQGYDLIAGTLIGGFPDSPETTKNLIYCNFRVEKGIGIK